MYLRKGLSILSDPDHQLWMTYLKINSHMGKLILFLKLRAVFALGVREPAQNSVALRHWVLWVPCTQELCQSSGKNTWKKRCVHTSTQQGSYTSIVLKRGASFDLIEFHSISDHKFYASRAPLTMQDVARSMASSALPKPKRFIMAVN